MTYAFKDGDAWVEIDGPRDVPNPTAPTPGQFARVTPAAAESYPPSLREALGLVEVVEAVVVAPGEVLVEATVEDVAGVPTRLATTAEIPLADLKAAKVAAIRERRAQAEAAGVTVGQAVIATDERTQNRVANALELFARDQAMAAVDWEVAPGAFVTLDEAATAAIGVAIGRHIQACFSRSRELIEAVAAAQTRGAVLALDIDAGWEA